MQAPSGELLRSLARPRWRCIPFASHPESGSSLAQCIGRQCLFLACSREDLGKVVAEIAQQEAQHRQIVVQVRAGMVLLHICP